MNLVKVFISDFHTTLLILIIMYKWKKGFHGNQENYKNGTGTYRHIILMVHKLTPT